MITDRRLGIGLFVVSFVALVLSGVTTIKAREFNQCQAGVNEQLIAALVERNAAAEDERRAARVVDDVFAHTMDVLLSSPPPSAPARTKALLDLQVALSEQRRQRVTADAARVANPLPEPPSQTCG